MACTGENVAIPAIEGFVPAAPPPELLLVIDESDIHLICWQAVSSSA